MKSSDVAALAGVTVRTLRHYHALGLLPEPPRQPNGYRDYGAADVARVLHIKRLAALGFPLSAVGEMLGEGAGQTELEALDELDRELALQMDRLREQRRTVALLRRERLDPALPVDFARVMKRLFGPDEARCSPEAAEADRAAMMIAGQFYTADDVAELERIADRLEERGLVGRLREVQRRTDGLPPDAGEAARAALVADSWAILEAVLDCIDAANWDEDEHNATLELLTDSLMRDALNPAQQDVNDRLDRMMADAIAAKGDAAAG